MENPTTTFEIREPDRTKADRVYDYLREMILELELPPGEHLRKDDIAARLGVSRSPVSDAIARLEKERLVDVVPCRGSFVAPIRSQDILECLFIRTSLEVEAARRFANQADNPARVALRANLNAQRQEYQRGEYFRMYDLDDPFHSIIFHSLNFDRSRELRQSVSAPVDRRLNCRLSLQDRAKPTLLEHEAIVDAAERNDATGAADAMLEHMLMVTKAAETGLARLEEDSTVAKRRR